MSLNKGPITRRFAEKCADALYMKIEMTKDRVKGKKRVILDLGDVKFPFELEIKGWFGNTGTLKADAGLLLQGPGSLAVVLVRRQISRITMKEEFLMRLIDIRDLEGTSPTIAKWWSRVREGVVGSDSFFKLTDVANRGTFKRVKGVWENA